MNLTGVAVRASIPERRSSLVMILSVVLVALGRQFGSIEFAVGLARNLPADDTIMFMAHRHARGGTVFIDCRRGDVRLARSADRFDCVAVAAAYFDRDGSGFFDCVDSMKGDYR